MKIALVLYKAVPILAMERLTHIEWIISQDPCGFMHEWNVHGIIYFLEFCNKIFICKRRYMTIVFYFVEMELQWMVSPTLKSKNNIKTPDISITYWYLTYMYMSKALASIHI